jgi:hypothetical protein
MHVLNWISISHKGTKQDVYRSIEEKLNGIQKTQHVFWDKFIIGGGRWNTGVDGEVLGKTATATKLPDNVTFDGEGKEHFNMILNHRDHHESYMFALKDLVRARRMEATNYSSSISSIMDSIKEDLNKVILDDFSIVTEDTMKAEIKRYTVKMIADFLNNQWTMDSYYYDIENHTSSLNPLKNRLEDNNLNVTEWLVPIDFHIRDNA